MMKVVQVCAGGITVLAVVCKVEQLGEEAKCRSKSTSNMMEVLQVRACDITILQFCAKWSGAVRRPSAKQRAPQHMEWCGCCMRQHICRCKKKRLCEKAKHQTESTINTIEWCRCVHKTSHF